MTLMKLSLEFLFIDLSRQFGICLVVFAIKLFINRHGVRGKLNKTHTTTTQINKSSNILKI